MHAQVNGIQMSYTDMGMGVPLLLVHGFPLNRGCWVNQVDAFRRTHRVIAPDLRGFGGSWATEGPVPMSRFAEDLHALIVRLGAGPAVLVGHSMGGYAALAFAKAFPEALLGLVLVSTRASADTAEAAEARRKLAARVLVEGPLPVVEAMAPLMLASGRVDPVRSAAVRAFMAPADPTGLVGALLGMADRPDATEGLGEILVPTLVIAGLEDDLIPPSESGALARAIPGAHLKLIPGAGHLVAFDAPEAFNHEVALWLVGTGLDSVRHAR